METYEWQKNKAIVDRLYYSERVLQTTIGLATLSTANDLLFVQKNYFAAAARARIPRVWMAAGLTNIVVLFLLLKPLTSHEIKIQWRKRQNMGKWLYSVYHLDHQQ